MISYDKINVPTNYSKGVIFMKSFRKYLAEFIGTFVLVLFACGVAAIVGCEVTGGYLATAFAFGLVIVAMAYSIGNVSGCHINPAVSIAMLVLKRISVKDFFGYIISQFLGAIAGGAVLKLIASQIPAANTEALGSNGLFAGSIPLTILVEVILTFVFVIAIVGVTSKEKYSKVAGIVIGLTLTLVHILGISLTGTSVNPARSLGTAIFATDPTYISNVWIFLVAPLVGGVLAALCYKLLDPDKEK